MTGRRVDAGEARETPMVVSPWLPTLSLPYAGTFVLDFARYVTELYGGRPMLVHLDDSYRSQSAFSSWVARRFVAQNVASARRRGTQRTLHIPLSVPANTGWVERSREALEVGRYLTPSADARGPTDVHAHVGLVAGSIVGTWPRHRYNLYVYEHASFVTRLLREDPEARDIYRATVARSRAVLCVNPVMEAELKELYPDHVDRIGFHPNAVDFERFQSRSREAPLRRWLYIGNVKPEKGSRRLIAAFQSARQRWEDVTLTVVGGGSDIEWIKSQGLGAYLRLLPGVAPSVVSTLMDEADLLVHLSDAETFGLTAIEAVASGLPVLLTSTQGSELVIRPVVGQAGTILPTDASPEDVVDAYAELREMPTRLDLGAARATLEQRFTMDVVRERLRATMSRIEAEAA